jgi:U2 small nuclear ribonucleoprotein A'
LQNYRYYVLHLIPSVRFLDFRKVRKAERDHALKLFGTRDDPSELARQVQANRKANPTTMNEGLGGARMGGMKQERVRLTAEERKAIEEMVRNAKSLEEITRLETMLKEGRVPGATGLE